MVTCAHVRTVSGDRRIPLPHLLPVTTPTTKLHNLGCVCVCGGGGGGGGGGGWGRGVIVYSQPRVGGGIMTVHLLVPPSHTHIQHTNTNILNTHYTNILLTHSHHSQTHTHTHVNLLIRIHTLTHTHIHTHLTVYHVQECECVEVGGW